MNLPLSSQSERSGRVNSCRDEVVGWSGKNGGVFDDEVLEAFFKSLQFGERTRAVLFGFLDHSGEQFAVVSHPFHQIFFEFIQVLDLFLAWRRREAKNRSST